MENYENDFYIESSKYIRFYNNIKSNDFEYPCQPILLTGPAGMGKTSFVNAIRRKLAKDNSEIVVKILNFVPSDDFSSLMKVLKEFSYRSKKGIFIIDDADHLLHNLNVSQAKIIREYLQTTIGMILVVVSRKIPSIIYDYNYPLYEFFKVITIDNLKFEDLNKLINHHLQQHRNNQLEKPQINQPTLNKELDLIALPIAVGATFLFATTLSLAIPIGMGAYWTAKVLHSLGATKTTDKDKDKDHLQIIDNMLKERAHIFEENLNLLNREQIQILQHFSLPDQLTIDLDKIPDSTASSVEFKSNISQLISWNIVSIDNKTTIKLQDVSLFLYLTRIRNKI